MLLRRLGIFKREFLFLVVGGSIGVNRNYLLENSLIHRKLLLVFLNAEKPVHEL